MSVHPHAVPYPFQPIKSVVEVAESLAGVIAPVCSTHKKLQHQANVNQGDLVIWRKVSLQDTAKHNHMNKMIHFGKAGSIISWVLEHRKKKWQHDEYAYYLFDISDHNMQGISRTQFLYGTQNGQNKN